MGVIITKREDESDLNRRISADLRERAKMSARGGRARTTGDAKDPDLVEDSDYAENLKTTGKFAWVWAVLIILAMIGLVVIILI